MIPATEEEKADVTEYYLSQSPDAEVKFLQKVYSEAITGHRHDVWDVHASDGRWWVITNPTNLYSQDQFPNMDLAVTFHMGLCLRVPRTHRQRKSGRNIKPFEAVLTKLHDASEALGQAMNVADYQAVGMRSREALLAFARAANEVVDWATGTAPDLDKFLDWNELFCDRLLGGGDQKARRRLFKKLLAEAWVFANCLTHDHGMTWHDAEAAQATTEHALGLAMSLVLRHIRSVPEQCPDCGSPHLSPQEGRHEELPDVIWERPFCANCGWAGTLVPVDEEPCEDDLFTRVGGDKCDECVVQTVPLTGLRRPGEE